MVYWRRKLAALGAAALLASCTTPAATSPDLDAVGERFVHLTLAIGEHEDGYVDAYYGPEAWAEAASAEGRDLASIRAEIETLLAELDGVDAGALDELEARRLSFLRVQLEAAHARVRMIGGEAFTFDEESAALYQAVAPAADWDELDATLARLETLVPGDGPLHERVDGFLSEFDIAEDRLEPVMRAAIDECRARTERHFALPEGERFELEFVTGFPWSGYNWYQGGSESLIQVNTDFPVRLSRAIDLACHEGYPGHHTLNALLEERLTRGRGWAEFSIYPLFSPQSFIAEGTANLGIDIAFPGDERTAFERDVLFPLAGLDPARAEHYSRVLGEIGSLWPARVQISLDYLDGRIDRDEAVELFQRYQLQSPARAEQSVTFTETYRAYVINYGYGQTLARAHLDAVAGDDQAARWAEFERLISMPTTALDLSAGDE